MIHILVNIIVSQSVKIHLEEMKTNCKYSGFEDSEFVKTFDESNIGFKSCYDKIRK